MIKTVDRKFILNLLITISLFVVLFNTYFFVIDKSVYQYSDWLVNYQGGFVRRGLLGEFFFQIHDLLSISLDLVLLFFIFLFYSFFYINLISIFKKIKINILDLFILFSPFSFFYPAFEQKISGRKDIIFLFSLAVFLKFINKINFYKQKYLIIFFIFLSSLSHSGFILFSSFFILIFILQNSERTYRELIFQLIPVFLSTTLCFLLIINFSKLDSVSVSNLCSSIKDYLPNCSKQDYITTLTWSYEKNSFLAKNLWYRPGYYFFTLLTGALFFSFMLYKINTITLFKQKINFKYFFYLTIVSTLPIYFIGIDYGRYLHITYLSLLIIIYSFYNKLNFSNFFFQNFKIKKFVLILVIFLYGFTWTIPHCCGTKLKFNFRNLDQVLTKIGFS
jgi:hypothetical protein